MLLKHQPKDLMLRDANSISLFYYYIGGDRPRYPDTHKGGDMAALDHGDFRPLLWNTATVLSPTNARDTVGALEIAHEPFCCRC